MSYPEVAIRLGIKNSALISNWRRKYHEEGIEGLSKNRGRQPMKENRDNSLDKKKSQITQHHFMIKISA